MNDQEWVYSIEQIDLEGFVEKYAMMIPEVHTLKFGLLLANGSELNNASRMALSGDAYQRDTAVRTLIRLGYMKREKVETGSA